jgi:hypothetical protein
MPVEVVEYRSDWPAEFTQIARRLRPAADALAATVDHVGSTAVPGLAAKNVIDIQFRVDYLDEPAITAAFSKLSYRRRPGTLEQPGDHQGRGVAQSGVRTTARRSPGQHPHPATTKRRRPRRPALPRLPPRPPRSTRRLEPIQAAPRPRRQRSPGLRPDQSRSMGNPHARRESVGRRDRLATRTDLEVSPAVAGCRGEDTRAIPVLHVLLYAPG